jgi:hypothetical protein
MHREIGLAIVGMGACLGLVTIIWWISIQIEKAHGRAAQRELESTLEGIPVIRDDGWDWPAGDATEHFLGDVEYDPVAHADAIISRMRADTDAFIARLKEDFNQEDDQQTVTIPAIQ